jgi:hypothetical protein
VRVRRLGGVSRPLSVTARDQAEGWVDVERRVTNSGVVDTSVEAEAVLVEGYRRMDGREKLRRVVSLNRTVERLARAGLRARHGDAMTEREMRLRLAGLRLSPQLMREAFDWDAGSRDD